MARPKKLSDKRIEEIALEIVKEEITENEEALVWITDKVAFAMRDLIRTLRKNYWGVYDKPNDPVTGEKKIWIPLSKVLANTARKSIDLDTKDVNFRSVVPSGGSITRIVRSWTREWFDSTFFGERLDNHLLAKCIDGTAVWKTYRVGGELKYKSVDLLNLYIDPGADSIQDAYRFVERALMTEQQVKRMDWDNTEDVVAVEGLHKTDAQLGVIGKEQSSGSFVEVFELWGKIPKKLISKNPNDDQEIDGHIIVSGIRNNGVPVVHLIEENTNKDKDGNIIKPYEEDWYRKVSGRWYGVGPVEDAMHLQLLVNLVVNTRINRNRVASLGLLKIRGGSGITQKDLSGLFSNGVIKVTNMDDVEQFVLQEAGAASYNDEQSAMEWARSVTGASEILSGEMLPASATATGLAIQDQNAKSGFSLIVDNTAHFLERWIDRHVLPYVGKKIKKGDVINITRNAEDLRQLIETVSQNLVAEEINKLIKEGGIPTPEEINEALVTAQNLLSKKKEIFVEHIGDIITKDLATEVVITNEEINVPVMVQNLLTMLQAVPEQRQYIVERVTELLGLDLPPVVPQQQQQQGGGVDAQDIQPQTEQEAVIAANQINPVRGV